MTEEKLIQKLRSLQAIQHRKDFTEQSRRLILAVSENPASRQASFGVFSIFSIGLPLVLASLMLVVMFGGITGLLWPSAGLPGADQEKLTAEVGTVSNDID